MKKIYPVLFVIALMLNGFVLNATEIDPKGIEKAEKEFELEKDQKIIAVHGATYIHYKRK